MSLNSITGMSHISEVVEETNQRLYRFKTGQLKPLKTFSKKLDSAIGGFYPGDQITIAARPGVGKSAFVNVLVDAIENNNKDTKTVILYFSLEMANYSQVIRLYSKETGITSKALQSAWEPLPEDSWNNVLKMSDRLKNRNIFFRDHKVTRYSWRKTMEEAFEKFRGHQLVSIVDHTRLITKMGGEKSEEEKITEFMADAVEFKNQTDSINIFLSQLNRNIESASGADREAVGKSAPRLTDIFGSDAVGQFSTLVLGLHRPEKYLVNPFVYAGETYDTRNFLPVFLLKQRDGEEGMIPLYHDLTHYRIADTLEELNLTNF